MTAFSSPIVGFAAVAFVAALLAAPAAEAAGSGANRFAQASTGAPSDATIVSGEMSCRYFVNAKLKTPVLYDRALGYVSGYLAAMEEMRVLPNAAVVKVKNSLFDHCYRRPNDTLAQAIGALTAAYRPQ